MTTTRLKDLGWALARVSGALRAETSMTESITRNRFIIIPSLCSLGDSRIGFPMERDVMGTVPDATAITVYNIPVPLGEGHGQPHTLTRLTPNHFELRVLDHRRMDSRSWYWSGSLNWNIQRSRYINRLGSIHQRNLRRLIKSVGQVLLRNGRCANRRRFRSDPFTCLNLNRSWRPAWGHFRSSGVRAEGKETDQGPLPARPRLLRP